MKKWLISLFLAFFGRWLARNRPEEAKAIDKGIDEIMPEESEAKSPMAKADEKLREKMDAARKAGNPKAH